MLSDGYTGISTTLTDVTLRPMPRVRFAHDTEYTEYIASLAETVSVSGVAPENVSRAISGLTRCT